MNQYSEYVDNGKLNELPEFTMRYKEKCWLLIVFVTTIEWIYFIRIYENCIEVYENIELWYVYNCTRLPICCWIVFTSNAYFNIMFTCNHYVCMFTRVLVYNLNLIVTPFLIYIHIYKYSCFNIELFIFYVVYYNYIIL